MSSKRTGIAALLLAFGALSPAAVLAEPPALPAPPPCGVRLSIVVKPSSMSKNGWVFKLAPGASRRLSGWSLVVPRLEPPGLYEVELTYTNDPRIGFQGEVLDNPARSPHAGSMACTAVSNVLRIEAPGH